VLIATHDESGLAGVTCRHLALHEGALAP